MCELHLEAWKTVFLNIIFKHFVMINIGNSLDEIALSSLAMELFDHKSTLVQVQVMAWCSQATS